MVDESILSNAWSVRWLGDGGYLIQDSKGNVRARYANGKIAALHHAWAIQALDGSTAESIVFVDAHESGTG